MTPFAALCLRRLRDCRQTGRPVPPQVIDDTIEALSRVVNSAWIRQKRDELICQAGTLLPDASIASKAKALAREAAAMQRAWTALQGKQPAVPALTPRDALHAARLIADLPESARQYMRILEHASGPPA